MQSTRLDGSKRPEAKVRIFGVRVTEREHEELETLAWSSGKTLSEWAREALLERNSVLTDQSIHHELFAEMVGLQMLLMGCFSPLLQGQRLTSEQYQELVRTVQSGKGKRAKELLAQRLEQKEK
jgi:hypothetical protein